MKIAIIGAGFCGLGLAYYLSQNSKHKITLVDQLGIGGGASGIAAGLLHPYVGFKGRLNWRGHEALEETKKLLQYSNQNRLGIIRIPQSEEQWSLFQETASQYDDVSICPIDHPGILAKEGILIKSGVTVNCGQYLSSLWDVLQKRGCELDIQRVDSLDQLDDFDCRIICNGPLAKKLLGIRLKLIKGQLLRLEWPNSLPPLPHSVVSRKYIVMEEDMKSCWVGATYEHHFDHEAPDLECAKKDILSDLEKIMPDLAGAPILDCQAGVRAFAPDKRPFYKRVADSTWVFTGMGSKGLLYHSLVAQDLAQIIS